MPWMIGRKPPAHAPAPCPHCGRTFKNAAGLASHQKTCKSKPEPTPEAAVTSASSQRPGAVIRAYIEAHPTASPPDVAAHLNVKIRLVHDIRSALVQEGRIPRLPSGHAKATTASAKARRERTEATPRPTQRQRWEIESEALAAQIRAEPEGPYKEQMRLQLLRLRYVPWAKRKEQGRATAA